MPYKVSIKGEDEMFEIYLFSPSDFFFFMANKIFQACLEKKISGNTGGKFLSHSEGNSKDKTFKER